MTLKSTCGQTWQSHFHAINDIKQQSSHGCIIIDRRLFEEKTSLSIPDHEPLTSQHVRNLCDGVTQPPEFLCILAHEFGHYQSFLAGSFPYFAIQAFNHHGAAWLTDQERKLIYSEEKLAWENAAEFLTQLSFDQWQIFRWQRLRGLNTYKRSLFRRYRQPLPPKPKDV